MRVVRKTREHIYSHVEELGEEYKKLLLDIFVNRKAARDEDVLEINTKLQEIKEKECWIQCDCKGIKSPLISIGVRDEKFYLIHMNARGDHEEWCEFKERVYKEGKRKTRKKIHGGSYFHIHRPHVKRSPSEENDTEPGKSNAGEKHYSRLAKVLYTLIEEAKINSINGEEKNINQQYVELRNSAKLFKLEKGIEVEEFLWTHPNQLKNCFIPLKMARDRWPKNSRPYGLFIFTIDSFAGNTIRTKIKEEEFSIKLNGVVKKSSGRLGERSGPYLAIFTITDILKKRGFYIPYNGFIVPVMSKADMFIVDSDYERRVAYELKAELARWKNMGINARLEKPLFDIVTERGDRVRPDFFIKTDRRAIIIEVQGSNEVEYRVRKERQISEMKKLGTVIEFDAVKEEINNSWDKGMYRLKGKIIDKLI